MTPRGIFQIVIATAGLVSLYFGLFYLIDGLLISFGLSELQHTRPGFYVLRGMSGILIGLLAMKLNSSLANLAFPKDLPAHERPDR